MAYPLPRPTPHLPFAVIPMMLVVFSPRRAPLSVTIQLLIVIFLQQMGVLSATSAGALAHQDISHASGLPGTQEG